MKFISVTNNYPIWHVRFGLTDGFGKDVIWDYIEAFPNADEIGTRTRASFDLMELRDPITGFLWKGKDVPRVIGDIFGSHKIPWTFPEFRDQARLWYSHQVGV